MKQNKNNFLNYKSDKFLKCIRNNRRLEPYAIVQRLHLEIAQCGCCYNYKCGIFNFYTQNKNKQTQLYIINRTNKLV